MKIKFSIIAFFCINLVISQTNANRFFYELTFLPKKNSIEKEKVLTVLDITNKKSIYQDYMLFAKDSLIKSQVEEMQKTKQFKNFSDLMTIPKIPYKIVKNYPEMAITYSELMFTMENPIQLGYKEKQNFNWKISSDKQKIGDNNCQKATLSFGGRNWTAWFANELPFQDGPYKFYGLPGLIVKMSDDKNEYSWSLVGNKKIENYSELSYLEKMQTRSETNNIKEVSKEKFDKTFSEYKKDPFGTIKAQLPNGVFSQKIPGSNNTVGDLLSEYEGKIRKAYEFNNNPIELY